MQILSCYLVILSVVSSTISEKKSIAFYSINNLAYDIKCHDLQHFILYVMGEPILATRKPTTEAFDVHTAQLHELAIVTFLFVMPANWHSFSSQVFRR